MNIKEECVLKLLTSKFKNFHFSFLIPKLFARYPIEMILLRLDGTKSTLGDLLHDPQFAPFLLKSQHVNVGFHMLGRPKQYVRYQLPLSMKDRFQPLDNVFRVQLYFSGEGYGSQIASLMHGQGQIVSNQMQQILRRLNTSF